MKARVTIRQLGFWRKVIDMTDDNPLKHVIKEAKRLKLKEIIHYEHIHTKYKNKEDIVE